MLCVCALVRAFARVWLFEDERARSHVRECVRRCVRIGNLSVGFCSSYAVCFRPFGETYVLYGVFCFGFHLEGHAGPRLGGFLASSGNGV